MAGDAGLTLRAVRIGLGGRTLVALDTHVPPGEVLSVMGPSGSGKSSLFAFIAGFLAPAFTAEGEVLVDGRAISGLPAHERRIGLLFQDALLFPHMNVEGNLLFGLHHAIQPKAERRRRVAAALAEAGLEGMGARDPATLSGGQKARVALMRTLLSEPRALLLDEPFSKLDDSLRAQMREVVFSTARRLMLPVLLVTHDAADAEAAGGPMIRLGA